MKNIKGNNVQDSISPKITDKEENIRITIF